MHPKRKKMLSPLVIFLALSGMILIPGRAQARRFSLYAYAYMDPEKRPSIKVNSAISYNDLVFLKRDNFYEAVYELYLQVMDRKGRVVETAVVKKRVTVPQYSETSSNKNSSRLSRSFNLKPGKYLIEATLVVKNTLLRIQKSVSVEVPDFLSEGIGLSRPRLYAVPSEMVLEQAPIVHVSKVDRERMVEKEYASFADFDRQPAMLFEIYTEELVGSLPCKLYLEVIDRNKKQLFYSNKKVKLSGREDEFLVLLDVDEWEPGTYKLNAKVVLQDPHREAVSSLKFIVAFSRSMLGRRFEATLAMLSIIASAGEIEVLKKATHKDRAKAWALFWEKRDPTPGTETNEALEEHLRRVQYVIEHFSALETGWRTDRGKVFIKHGTPDQIESTIDPYLQGEYQIWRYYSLNLVFVFYDRYGLGDYNLVSMNTF